jgi:hypothetical protein
MKETADFYHSSIAYVIILFNVFIRNIVIKGVTWIGYGTESEKVKKITIGTFLCYLNNSAFCLLFVNFDFSRTPLLNIIFGGGSYADFN